MANNPREFVEGWQIMQTLGEGAFGQVKLLVHPVSGEMVAMKIVQLQVYPQAAAEVKQETVLQKMLKHTNVLKYLGTRTEYPYQFIFLEYAAGGELYDRIEPDKGTGLQLAMKYFKQLIDGVEYMHSVGIVHRDLKLENLLLDVNDVLKICDFGLATLFKYKGRERVLDKRCGTPMYLAPDILQGEYAGPPVDIWSCGVILVVMLSGELPFDSPTANCPRFKRWMTRGNELNYNPWLKIKNSSTLSLLKKMLSVNVKNRITMHGIFKDAFYLEGQKILSSLNDEPAEVEANENEPPAKRVRSFEVGQLPFHYDDDDGKLMVMSQPPPQTLNPSPGIGPVMSFSQPSNPEHLLLSAQLSQPDGESEGTQPNIQRQVRRMTRLIVNVSMSEAITALENLFTEYKYTHKRSVHNVITINTMDSRGTNLIIKTTILELGSQVLVDFRLSKGCGLDFKRQFLRIKQGLSSMVDKGPVTWSMAHATNSLPS